MTKIKKYLILAIFSAFFFVGKSVFASDFAIVDINATGNDLISFDNGTQSEAQSFLISTTSVIKYYKVVLRSTSPPRTENFCLSNSFSPRNGGCINNEISSIVIGGSGFTQYTIDIVDITVNPGTYYLKFWPSIIGDNRAILQANFSNIYPDGCWSGNGSCAGRNEDINLEIWGSQAICGNGIIEDPEMCDSDTIPCGGGIMGNKTCNNLCNGYNDCVKSSSLALTTISGGIITKSTELASFSLANFWGYFLIIIIIIALMTFSFRGFSKIRENNIREEDEKLKFERFEKYERPEKRKIKFKKYRED